MSSPSANLKKVKRSPLPGNSIKSVPFRHPAGKLDPSFTQDESPLPATNVNDRQGLKQPDYLDDTTQRSIVSEIRRHAKIGGAKTTGHAPSDSDLLGSMATRLSQVERELLAAKREIVEKNQYIKVLEEKVINLEKFPKDSEVIKHSSSSQTYCRQLELQCQALQTQVEEMEEFLNDYGMVWVGQGDTHTNGSSIQEQQTYNVPMWSPGDSVAEENAVNFDLIVKHVQELNSISEKTAIRTTRHGATLQPLDAVPLTLFKNGLVLFGGPFRPYSDPATQECIQDLTDGYFPSELRARYPEGVPLKLTDYRDTVFRPRDYADIFPGFGKQLGGEKGPSRLLASGAHLRENQSASKEMTTLPGPKVSLDRFLTSLPATVVKGGRVVDIRSGVAETLQEDANGSQLTLVETPVLQELKSRLEINEKERPPTPSHVTTLRIRSENGIKTYVLKLKQSDTIKTVRQHLNKRRGDKLSSNYYLKSSFPPRTYADLSKTLADYGLVSNTNLFMSTTL